MYRGNVVLLLSKSCGLTQRCLCLSHTTVLYELEQQCLYSWKKKNNVTPKHFTTTTPSMKSCHNLPPKLLSIQILVPKISFELELHCTCSIKAPDTKSEMFMWGLDSSAEQCYILYFFLYFCLVPCFVGGAVVHIYFCMCVHFSQRVWYSLTYTHKPIDALIKKTIMQP